MLSTSVITSDPEIYNSPLSASNSRQRSSLKTSLSQNDISNSLHEDLTKQISFEKNTELQLLSGSVSFLPEMYLQSYHGSTNTVDNMKEETYVLTAGKAKPGGLRKTYKSLKQSKLVQLCR